MEKQLIKDSEKIHSEKIYPTKFMFTDGMELKINHNELPGWNLATESAKEVRWYVHIPVNLLLFFFLLLNIMWIVPLDSMTSLTISSVVPSNMKTALESLAVLDALVLNTNLGG